MNQSQRTENPSSSVLRPHAGFWRNVDVLLQHHRRGNETKMVLECIGFAEHTPISANRPAAEKIRESISTLTIENDESNTSWTPGDLIYLLQHLPNLKDLTIEDLKLDEEHIRLSKLPHLGISLKSLRISSCTAWAGIVCLLGQFGVSFKILEKLDIAGPWISYAENPNGTPVTPEQPVNLAYILGQAGGSLRKLRLELHPPALLSQYGIHRLESLEVVHRCSDYDDNGTEFLKKLHWFGCQLRDVSLSRFVISNFGVRGDVQKYLTGAVAANGWEMTEINVRLIDDLRGSSRDKGGRTCAIFEFDTDPEDAEFDKWKKRWSALTIV